MQEHFIKVQLVLMGTEVLLVIVILVELVVLIQMVQQILTLLVDKVLLMDLLEAEVRIKVGLVVEALGL